MHANNFSLEGKAAIIIGASRGIGAATARAFVAHGARVTLASRDEAALESLAEELRDSGGEALVVKMDAGVSADVIRAVSFTEEKFGRLDIAFNNAGLSTPDVLFADVSEEEFHRIMSVNLFGLFVAMKHEIKAMLRCGGGSIINTSSIGGFMALGMSAPYVASKHGNIGLVRAAALDHASSNIRVNTIAPGPVWTEMSPKATDADVAWKAQVEAITPMGRFSTPNEQANSVVWLASDASTYVTGAVITVDGGYTLP